MKHTTTEQLIDYMHGALASEDDAAVYAHIQTCADCKADYHAEITLSEALKAGAAAEELEFPSMIKANVWAAVRNEPLPLMERLRALLLPAAALPIAAAVALFLFFGNNHTGGPSIQAAYYLEAHAAHQAEIPLGDRAASSSAQLESAAELSSAADDLITTDVPSAAAGISNDVR